MDTIILMLIAAAVALLVIILGVGAAILTQLIKFFQVENISFKKSLVIILVFMFVGFFTNSLFRAINLGIISDIFSVAALFLVFYYLLKKYYQVGWKRSLLIYIIFSGAMLIVGLLIIVPAQQFIAQPFYVNGDSMSPNYNSNDYLLLVMFDRKFVSGDVVIYRNPLDREQFYIKRIVGLPGEKIEIQNGRVLINGQTLSEPYANGITVGSKILTLGAGEYYVLGDNRSKSADSRFHGPIKSADIVGQVVYNFSSQR